MEQKQKNLDERIEELRQKLFRLRALVQHPGWKDFRDSVGEQVFMRREMVFKNQISRLDDCFLHSSLISEIAGLQGAIAFPQLLIEDLEHQTALLLEEQREAATIEE